MRTHTLKGVAANLAVEAVHQATQRLETAFKEAPGKVHAALDELRKVQERALSALDVLIEGAAAPAGTNGRTDLATLEPLMRDLDARLSASDASATAALGAVQSALGEAHRAVADDLAQLIAAYDFDTARRKLAEFAQQVGAHIGATH
jgi:HPt (histidine-containing phosphotransfer) domain-containing protein